MYILCNDIFFSLLTQNVQQPDTSEFISKELMEKFHNFLLHFYYKWQWKNSNMWLKLLMNLLQNSILLEKYGKHLIVLIRKLCNVIIKRGIEFVGQNPLNKIIDDPDKDIQVLDITRQVIQKLIDAYFQFKDSDSNSWQIARNVIFFRLNSFNDRIGDI